MSQVQDSQGFYLTSAKALRWLVPFLRQALLDWYAEFGRNLPWRMTQDPYAIWISEIMLQQTQVQTVIPYYHRWLATFPDIEILAQAPLQQVLKLWQGLGYYARARNLHAAAQILQTQHHGQFPRQFDQVMALPGIGRTTAGGILSAAFNAPQPILDGNVKRVLARLHGLEQPPAKALKTLWVLSADLLDPTFPRDFNQALMDLGATVCLPKNPQCPRCPWVNYCQAHLQQRVHELPMTTPRPALPHKLIGVAVIWNQQQQVLIDRRPTEGLLGGLWEFPGGKLNQRKVFRSVLSEKFAKNWGLKLLWGRNSFGLIMPTATLK